MEINSTCVITLFYKVKLLIKIKDWFRERKIRNRSWETRSYLNILFAEDSLHFSINNM